MKSPFFRAWQGDWREFDTSAINVPKIPIYDSNDVKEQRGAVYNIDTGMNIILSGNGERNTLAHSGEEKRSLYGLANIRGLMANAILLDTEIHEHHQNNTKNDYIVFNHKFYSLGEDSEKNIALYKITVEEYFQSTTEPNNKRFHNLKYIKKVAEVTPRAHF